MEGVNTMKIIVNGQQESFILQTVDELVQHKGLEADSLVVELNRKIIRQAQWSGTHLQENDEVELLNFVGGG
jgi:sulfur carrier protein